MVSSSTPSVVGIWLARATREPAVRAVRFSANASIGLRTLSPLSMRASPCGFVARLTRPAVNQQQSEQRRPISRDSSGVPNLPGRASQRAVPGHWWFRKDRAPAGRADSRRTDHRQAVFRQFWPRSRTGEATSTTLSSRRKVRLRSAQISPMRTGYLVRFWSFQEVRSKELQLSKEISISIRAACVE